LDLGSNYSLSTNNMTVDYCQSICSGYKYFGVEKGTDCYCGDTYGDRTRSSSCNATCVGDSSQTCGGSCSTTIYSYTACAPIQALNYTVSVTQNSSAYVDVLSNFDISSYLDPTTIWTIDSTQQAPTGYSEIFFVAQQPGFNFTQFDSTTPIHMVGNSTIRPDGTLRVVSNEFGQSGTVYYSKMVDIVDLEFRFSFSMSDLRQNPGYALGADGLAFIIQNSPDGLNTIGHYGYGVGYDGIPNSIVVELDNYKNAEFGDPDDRHISIHTRGAQANSANEIYSLGRVSVSNLKDGNAHDVLVRYRNSTIQVYYDGSLLIEAKYNIPRNVPLSKTTQAWVGFSSSTGGASANHDVHSWSMVNYFQGDSRIRYTPTCQFVGSTSFPYTIVDSSGVKSTGYVTVNVNPDYSVSCPSTTGVQTTDIQTTDIQTTDVQTTDVQTTDVQTTDVQTTGVQTTDIQTTGVQTTGPFVCRFSLLFNRAVEGYNFTGGQWLASNGQCCELCSRTPGCNLYSYSDEHICTLNNVPMSYEVVYRAGSNIGRRPEDPVYKPAGGISLPVPDVRRAEGRIVVHWSRHSAKRQAVEDEIGLNITLMARTLVHSTNLSDWWSLKSVIGHEINASVPAIADTTYIFRVDVVGGAYTNSSSEEVRASVAGESADGVSQGGDDDGLSSGRIVGIVVGTVIGLFIIVALVEGFILLSRRRRQKSAQEASPLQGNSV